MEVGEQFVFNDVLISFILKWLFVICFGFYTIFAFVLTRQIRIMRSTLITSFSSLFTTLGYVHLGIASFLTVLFFLIL